MKQATEICYCKTFCKNIAWLRKQHRLSKKEMAKLLGIGVRSLNMLEQGKVPPQLKVNVLFAVQSNFGIKASKQLTKFLGEDH